MTIRILKQLSPTFTLDIDLETQSDCPLGILGVSGAGKSMTLKCIAGLETPDEGFIELDGTVLFDSNRRINLKPQERRAGYLFQHYALFPHMTLLENLTVVLTSSQYEKNECAYHWIDKFGLAGLEHRFPRKLSGGQQQRAALARIFLSNPRAMLLDEPFSALDADLCEYMRIEIAGLINGMMAENFQNTILVTHSRDDVFALCQDLAIMDSGRVIARGKPETVFNNPGTVQAARLTGCKNISSIKHINDFEFEALDWGTHLRVIKPLARETTHIAIRAHHLEAGFGRDFNEIPIVEKQRSTTAFETTVLVSNIHYREGIIWWKLPRTEQLTIPATLYFPPEQLMPLKNA
ncbi:MAG: ATP-binding cassette domain-containing protein [Spirochaetaceae bacterium]|jgi:molybdate transport system ATP-binding protein|nr:ATP-binding cassette domain-containing protein [Spirochaetaceae bacterium]